MIGNKGENSIHDEDPLGPMHGYGYNFPLFVGDRLDDDQFEVVRKLGLAGYSSVWLARVLKSVSLHAVRECIF